MLGFRCGRIADDAMAQEFPGRLLVQVFPLEDVVDVGRGDFAPGFVGDALDRAAEFDLQAARQDQPVLLFQQVGHAALAGLAVDADHGIVAAAQVRGIDGQVGHFPQGVGLLLREAFLDGVLVRAREGREHQIARIGMTRMHGQLVAVFRATAHLIDVRKIQAGMHALRVQVQRQRHQIDVARALAAAEQAALDAVRARHDGEFGGRHGRCRGRYAGARSATRLSRRAGLRCTSIRSGRRTDWGWSPRSWPAG